MIPSAHQLSLRLLERCPSCHATVPVKNIHIIDESEINILAHIDCAQCHTKYLTYIVNHPQGLVGNALLTDLSYDETLDVMQRQALTEDEFLGLYRLMSGSHFITTLQ